MFRVITNRFRSKRNCSFITVTALIALVLLLKPWNSYKVQDDKFMDAVVLSKRGLFSTSSIHVTSSNYSLVEETRRKLIDRYGVLSSLKPGLPGFVNVHLWFDLCGTDILTLKQFPLFPSVPSTRLILPSLEIDKLASKYGKRVFGYIIPPTSGKYSFRLSTSGAAEFWLSTDDKAENKLYIMSSKREQSTSLESGIYLQNLQSYYFEILHKYGGRKWFDTFSLEWKTDNSKYRTISTKYLKSYQDDRHIYDDVVNVHSFLGIHKPNDNMKSPSHQIVSREQIYRLPFISAQITEHLFLECEYKPNYLVTYELKRYGSKWENIYPAIYPSDETNVTESNGFVTFGNDILEEEKAVQIANMVMKKMRQKGLRQFKLENIINIEEKGEKYLVELQLLDKTTQKSVRFSEYVLLPKNAKELCYPNGHNWNKTSMVNIIVTAGRNQGRWVYHLIKNMENIYKETNDSNFNVVINDFLCPDADIRRALETSSLPNYVYLTNPGQFQKTLGLQQAAGAVRNGIVAILDLHLDVPPYYIDDIRKHTLQGVQFYSPILQRFECGTNFDVDMGSFWEFHGYGLVGIYKSDWDQFGGMNVEEFKHKWGGEDIEMTDRILMAGFEGYRKKVKFLVHYYHSKTGMWNKKHN